MFNADPQREMHVTHDGSSRRLAVWINPLECKGYYCATTKYKVDTLAIDVALSCIVSEIKRDIGRKSFYRASAH